MQALCDGVSDVQKCKCRSYSQGSREGGGFDLRVSQATPIAVSCETSICPRSSLNKSSITKPRNLHDYFAQIIRNSPVASSVTVKS